MILEIDVGNSYIKWRSFCQSTGSAGPVLRVKDLESVGGGSDHYDWCRMVSVRSQSETDRIAKHISSTFSIEVALFTPVREFGRVRNGYRDWSTLGADRWAAVLAGYDLSRGPALVIDMGTAITVDLIAGDGDHLGGFISPGLGLMRSQLLEGADLVKFDPASPLDSDATSPGVNTASALAAGCLLMTQAYLREQIEEAVRRFGEAVKIYVTGGDACLLEKHPRAIHVPDLVFRGLAIGMPERSS